MPNTVPFIPNGLRYLVLADSVEAESETIGAVTITKQADTHKPASEGTVVAVGDGIDHDERCKYALQDKVVYGKYSGYEQKFDGVDYKVLAQSEILGVRIVTPFDQKVMPFEGETGCILCGAQRPLNDPEALYCTECFIKQLEL